MFRLTTILIAMAAAQAAPHLMPLPAKLTESTGHLAIDSSFRIAAGGYKSVRLDAAIARTESRIFRQFGFATIAERRTALTVECRQEGAAYPALGEDESYRLDVAPGGAHLNARTVTGAMRG